MHLSKVISTLAALAGPSVALDLSSTADQDGSVWTGLDGNATSSPEVVSNRPFKRQSGWNPPSNLVTPLKQVWDHCLSTYSNGLYGFKNYGWDQIRATSGYVSNGVRFVQNLGLLLNDGQLIIYTTVQKYQCLCSMGVQHGYHRGPASTGCICVRGSVSKVVFMGLRLRQLPV